MIRNNIPAVMAQVKKAQMQLDVNARLARDKMAARLTQLAQEEIKGDRASSPYPAISGNPPMNVTGNLRRSIRFSKYRLGFASYGALVGPTIVYARAVELGGAPTWRNGQNFPYMKPAFEKYKKEHHALVVRYLKLKG